MLQFELADFLAPLDFWVILMSFALGISLGIAIYFSHMHPPNPKTHFFWLASSGVVFFIPLSILRAFQNSPVWERLLSTLILWLLFSLGMVIANWILNNKD